MAPSDPSDIEEPWFDDDGEDEDLQVEEYDLVATPNDFNVKTIFDFIASGSVKIPAFQRNYVWDIYRASKLIESIILGLPVPQVFLYEEGRNRFLVIDGQQRLMSIYYFIRKRFPRKDKRVKIRAIFDEHDGVPEEIIDDDEYFQPFRLHLPERIPGRNNIYKGLNYSTLGEYRSQFDLRPIRNVIVKQVSPKEDDSSVFEVFNRLNSGGINLHPQEVRMSLYHSPFYGMLLRTNLLQAWRRLLGRPEPDLHMKDIEFLLRAIGLLIDGKSYPGSMVRFLNRFSRRCQNKMSSDDVTYLEGLFNSFLVACQDLADDAFLKKTTKRFNHALFESVFVATCETLAAKRETSVPVIDPRRVSRLELDGIFVAASEKATTQTANVEKRIARARLIFGADK